MKIFKENSMEKVNLSLEAVGLQGEEDENI